MGTKLLWTGVTVFAISNITPIGKEGFIWGGVILMVIGCILNWANK